ncbi:MAG: aminotransferase class I/II-fold pyridoxal phosphate-dependent enzyme [Clostridia bacterium]
MYSFSNDYSEGAHERILNALVQTNREQTPGYGLDPYCELARTRIAARLNHPGSAVHFLVGGTQVNATVIAAALKPYQGVVSAVSGHINVHESGAIEATGHKVLPLPSADGKVSADTVDALAQSHFDDATAEHAVQPGMLYISNPTEIGTIYSKTELASLYEVCHRHGMRLYVDGARLGCALTSQNNDLALPDLAQFTDAFTIGGTKMGALFGEALVINDPALNVDFRYHIKQRGGMFAKGRLLGIQFAALFEDDLYFTLAQHANDQAERLREGIRALGYSFLTESPTNQIFPILPKSILAELDKSFIYSFWQPYDETHSVVRFCTSWATDPAQVDALLKTLRSLPK